VPRIAKELGPLAVKGLTTAGLHPVGGVAGLMLQGSPSGARSWLLRVKVGHKRREIGLGAFPGVTLALAREKALKAWRREKKVALIESTNPAWIDLAAEWYDLRDVQADSSPGWRGDSG